MQNLPGYNELISTRIARLFRKQELCTCLKPKLQLKVKKKDRSSFSSFN